MDAYRDVALYYDLEHQQFCDDIDFYLGHVRGPRVLEVGAGTGRIVEPLSAAGLEVWGVDSSPTMLAVAKRRLHGNTRAHLVESEIEKLELPDRFDAALFTLNMLGHLRTLEDQLAALRTVHRHLVHRGQLIVDLSNPLTMADRGANGVVRQRFSTRTATSLVTGLSAVWDDSAEQMMTIALTYEDVDSEGILRRRSVDLLLRYMYRYEVELLLMHSGFHVLELFGDYDEQPYTPESPNLIVLAEAL